MSIISSLTQNESSNVKQLNLQSTLPTKIRTISSLQRFHSLLRLNLSNNCIQTISNISHLTQLKILNLDFNQLTVLDNLQNLKNLEELFVSYNSISAISPKIQLNKKLKVFNLGFNDIKSIDVLTPVFGLEKMVVLSLHGNPFINTLNYMVFIKLLMPDLLYLDDKDLNNTNLESELYPQEQVAILRDTLNKLLEERNYLAEQLQNLTSISSPTKITLKEYLKNHQQSNQKHNSISEQQINKIATFSPLKGNSMSYFTKGKKQNKKSKLNRSANPDESSYMINIENIESKHRGTGNEREKMLEILTYWMGKLQQKISLKKSQLSELHEYYTNKLQQRQQTCQNHKRNFLSEQKPSRLLKRYQFQDQNEQAQDHSECSILNEQKMGKYESKITTKEILKQIKQKQSELNGYKSNMKSLKQLIEQINALEPNQEMYKIIMMRVLFGDMFSENGNSGNQLTAHGQKDKKVKRQLNYRELKHFLLSDYGLLNALNHLNQLVFGTGEFSIDRVNELRSWTGDKSLLEIVNEAKSQLKHLKKEQKSFQKQKKLYLQKLQAQTQELYNQWSEFNQNKKQFQFDKGKQFKYEQKLLQQRQSQLQNKFQDLKMSEARKLELLQQQKITVQNQIVDFRQKLQQLQERYQRRYLELEQFEKQFNSFKSEKQNMVKMQDELKIIKKQLFQKENLIAQTTEKLKQLSLNQQINSERVKFLQRKCYEKSEEIKSLDEQEKKLKEKIKKLTEEDKIKSLELSNLKEKINQYSEEEKSTLKNIERHKNNLTLYEQKLKNLSELESHKKKSIQDFQLRIQEEKAEFMHLNQKNLELEEILAQKQENIHSYQLKISQQKKSLESYSDISKNIQDLMDRQSQLKKSILELEIQNGNLMDLKNQLVRELRQSELSVFKSRNEW